MWNTVSSLWSRWWDAGNKEDENSRATVTATISIFVVFWFLWAVVKPKKAAPPLPPGPRGLPLVGYLPCLGTEIHRKFHELASVYGPIYKFWLGKKLRVVISSPSLVKAVRDLDPVFAHRDPNIASLVFSSGGADIAFSPYGDDWRKLRKVFVREMLSKTNLDGSFTFRREEVKKSIRHAYKKIVNPVNLGELAFKTVGNAMISMVWGDTLQGEEGANFGAEFKSMIEEQMVLMGKPNVSDSFPVLARFDLQGIERKSKRIIQSVEKIIDSAIEKRMNMSKAKERGEGKSKTGKDFLQILLELREHGDAVTSITMTQLKALLMDVIVAGSDSTATMVEWVMTKLLQHPEAMEKVGEELTKVVGLDNLVDESHLPKLHYLDAVIKDSFRMQPPASVLVARCPSQSSTIGGYMVPKGATVLLNFWTIQRDPQIWENPLEFKPERFLSDPRKFDYSGNKSEYIPFGSGRRICPGILLAERLLVYVIASFLHSFEWKLEEGVELDLSDKFGLATKKRSPLVVVPTPRLSKLELYAK